MGPGGQLYACLDAEELWGTMSELIEAGPSAGAERMEGAMLLGAQMSGDRLVVVAPSSAIHPCGEPEVLWETVDAIIHQRQVTAVAIRQGPGLARTTGDDVQTIYDQGGARRRARKPKNGHASDSLLDAVFSQVSGLDEAGTMAVSLASTLRGMSHRGGSPRARKRASNADILRVQSGLARKRRRKKK